MSKNGKIVPLTGPVDLVQMNPHERFDRQCLHPRTAIDSRDRTVSCTECRAALDPFDVLCSIARARRRRRGQLDEIGRAAKAAQADVDQLRREERRIRARLRRLEQQDPVQQDRGEILAEIDGLIERAMRSGAPPEKQTLTALIYLCSALLPCQAFPRFERKIHRAIDEIEARERRKSMRVVAPRSDRKREAR